jgi:uncharacterized lipoprotein YmbA
MLHRILPVVSITFVALGAAACSTAPSRFYTLASTATPNDAPPARYAVMVGPVSVPGTVDRPEFVVQTAPNRVEIDEFNRWAASPTRHARAAAGISQRSAPMARLGRWRISILPFGIIDVWRFETIPANRC